MIWIINIIFSNKSIKINFPIILIYPRKIHTIIKIKKNYNKMKDWKITKKITYNLVLVVITQVLIDKIMQ